ncbi:beta strand repeat-containing protein [Puniceibacterium sediminis]|uniref:beta strand repeat-containing protein n=1 Tax=Puniceibacterium sediminis TaxID=1608407 RepID=UPI001595B0E1|nr:Ig-like domain-containing protein [Puniceibacterium sediminis]
MIEVIDGAGSTNFQTFDGGGDSGNPIVLQVNATPVASSPTNFNCSAGCNVSGTYGGTPFTSFVYTFSGGSGTNSGAVGPPANLAATSGGGQSTAISTGFASALVATVTDAGGNPVAGETVSFAVPGSGASATLSASSGVTNASGQVSVTATANATAGSYNVTASSGSLSNVTFALTNTAGAAATLAATSGGGQSTAISTGFASALVATVTDAGGNPVAGETVSFAVPGSGASATLSASSGVTNASGQVSVTATANATAGSYNVTASSGSLSNVTFALTNTAGAAATLAATSGGGQSTAISTGFASALVATVTDAGGNPVAGETVSFAVPGSGASATLSASSGVTNASGQVSVTATANATAGSYNVTASSGSLSNVTFALTNADVTAPSVTLTTSATGSMPGKSFSVNAAFSETVVGFTASDVAVTNGSVSGLAGSGASYVITISPTGGGDTTVSIPASVVQDTSGNDNLASNTLSIQSETITETARVVKQFIERRSGLLLGSQPNLTGLLSGSARGIFSASITSSQGRFKFSSKPGSAIWTTFHGSKAKDGDTKSTYLFGAVGTHHKFHENLLGGVLLEYDYLEQDTGVSSVIGHGWMAGPYLVTKVPDQDVYLEGRLLYGRSSNEISPFGTYTDDMETERLLAMLKVSGELQYDVTTLIPSLQVSYVTDEQEAYTDSVGNEIPSQGLALSELEIGIDFETPAPFAQRDRRLLLTGGVSAIASDITYTGAAAETSSNDGSLRARVELGFNYRFANQELITLGTYYDGIGISDYESYGLDFSVKLEF